MYNLLKSDIYKGNALELLAKADATDEDIEVFGFMDNYYKTQISKLERAKQRK